MMRMMGLALLALLAAWASADTVPLDAKIRPVGGSAGRTWHFAAEEVKLGGKPYRTHAYLQNADGDRADGWIRFDVTDWERFTATVGVNDRWLDTAGALIIEVDGKKTAEITKRSGEAPQQVDLPLIGATTLTFRFVLAILLAEPALARLDPAVLQITTTPAGATVVVEGQPAATVSPCTVAVPMRGRATREVEIRVDLRNYSTLTRTVAVNAGQTIPLALTLEAIPILPPGTRAGEGRTNPKDGAALVWVPAGDFLMGSTANDGFGDERPQRRVYLDGYWIYQYEVTVAQYRAFCAATGRALPPFPITRPYSWKGKVGWADPALQGHPIVMVSWDDAAAYAAWAGAQLPTEAQWEKAARGADGRRYPWGDAWDPAKCANYYTARAQQQSTWPVGSFPAGASPYGAHDMAGNALEWCADWYEPGYYRTAPARNPPGPATGEVRVLRGGSWSNNASSTRSAFRIGSTPSFRFNYMGFRCVVLPPAP